MKSKIIILLSSILFCFCNPNQKQIDKELIGTWEGSLIDSYSNNKIEKLIMQFEKNGDLTYIIGEGEMKNTMNMKYWTKKNSLFSKETDSSEIDEAKYQINKNKLTIEVQGIKNELIKIK